MEYIEIIRCVDDLGRIVIPKDVRRKTGIKEGDQLTIRVESGSVILTKYNPGDYEN